MKITAEERRRQKDIFRRQGLPLGRNTAPPLLQRICSFQVKYRELAMIIIGLLGIIGGVWVLISWLEIKFLGPLVSLH